MSADIAYGIPPRVVQSRKRAIDSSFLAEGQISFQEERSIERNGTTRWIKRLEAAFPANLVEKNLRLRRTHR